MPGLTRDRSWESVNPLEQTTPQSKGVADASRIMTKHSHPNLWVKELEMVEEAAKEVKLPNTRVTALALDALARFAKVVPAQERVILDLIARIDDFIYPQTKEFETIVGDDSDKAEGETVHDSSGSSASSRDSSPVRILELSFDAENMQPRLASSNPWGRYMRKLERSDLYQENWLAALDEAPARGASYSSFSTPFERPGSARRGAFQHSLTDDPLKIKAAEGWFPPQYADRMPFFFIDRKQRWDMRQARERLRWMHEICTNIEGQQRAQMWLFDFLHELTYGKLLNWVWAYWKAYFMEVYTFRHQVTGLKSTQRFMLYRVVLTWRNATILGSEYRKTTEDQERRLEMCILKKEALNVEKVLRELHIALEISDGGACRLERQRETAEMCAARFRKQFDVMQPQVVKEVLYRLLASMLEHSTILAGIGHIACKARLLTKDFTHLVAHDDDSVKSVGQLSSEDFVIRWINHLLVEVKYCAADLLEHAGKDAVSDTRSAWSTKDAPIFGNRCRRIRAVYFVEHLGEDMKDGTVLIALCAMIRAHRHGHSVFDPVDLWPLDVRDADARLEAVCCFAQALAPTRAAKCILRKQDITSGNRKVLLEFLAALLLAEAPGLNKVLDKSANAAEMPTNHDARHLRTGKDNQLQDAEEDDSEAEEDDETTSLLAAFNTLHREALYVALDHSEDPSLLLRKGESMKDLARIPAEEVLLRWVNCHITAHGEEGIHSISTDLRDGSKLFALMKKVAPDVLRISGIAKDLAPDLAIQAVVQCASRCVDPCSITAEAIRSGSEDMLIGFLGNLFMIRPSLQPRKNSEMSSHVDLVARIYEKGHTVSRAGKDETNTNLFHSFCREVKVEQQSLSRAVSAILNARRVMAQVRLSMDACIVKSFSQRAKKGLSSTAQAKRSSVLASSTCSVEHARIVDYPFLSTDPLEMSSKRVRDVVQSHAPFIQEVFEFYAVSLAEGEPRLPLEGIMRIYTCCKCRCPCVGVPPTVAEAFYYDELEQDLPACRHVGEEQGSEKFVLEGLSVRGFIRWLLRIAIYQLEKEPQEKVRFHTVLAQFFERHLEPYACQIPKEEFAQMTHSKRIRAVFMAREFVLQAIFESYSTKVGHINKTSERRSGLQAEADEAELDGRERIMDVDAFIRVITNAGLVHGTLTEEVIESLFKNVAKQGGRNHDDAIPVFCSVAQAEFTGTTSCSSKAPPSATKLMKLKRMITQSSMDCCSPNSNAGYAERVTPKAAKEDCVTFFEFLHCLLAVALYTNPNPMLAVQLRVEQFLSDTFLPGLIAHVEAVPLSGADEHQPHLVLLQALTDIDKADEFRMNRLRERRNFLQRGMIVQSRKTLNEVNGERRANSADGEKMLMSQRHEAQVLSHRRPRSQSPYHNRRTP